MNRDQSQVEQTKRIARETAEELGAEEDTVDLALKMVEVVVKAPEALTKDVHTVAASCLYAASLLRGPKLSQEMIAEADSTTAVTIRNHYRWAIRVYAETAHRIPTDVQKRLDRAEYDE